MLVDSKIEWISSDQAPFLDKVKSSEVFDFCLDYVERADNTIISSFAINEAFVRRLVKNRHKLGHISVLWDVTMATRSIEILMFLTKNVDAVYLVPNHSKMIWMQGKRECISVSSLNTTGNFRNEGGLVTSNPLLVKFYKQNLQRIIKESTQWKLNSNR